MHTMVTQLSTFFLFFLFFYFIFIKNTSNQLKKKVTGQLKLQPIKYTDTNEKIKNTTNDSKKPRLIDPKCGKAEDMNEMDFCFSGLNGPQFSVAGFL